MSEIVNHYGLGPTTLCAHGLPNLDTKCPYCERDALRAELEVFRADHEIKEGNLAVLREKLDAERAKREEAERAFEQKDEECERYSDALAETHIALGGDGEWVAKMPSLLPPESGDLALDVPCLAAEVQSALAAERAKREEAERERDLLRERLDQFEAYAMPNVATALDRILAAEARAERLAAVDAAARELFRALDHVTPRWREGTCIVTADSDEVNVAWCELLAALVAAEARP